MDAKNIIADASARRDTALAEAKRWSEFIAMTEELYGLTNNGRSATKPQENSGLGVKRDFSGATLLMTQEAAVRLITEAGHPLSTRELLLGLELRDVPVGGKDPASTLSARLSRSPALINVRPHGWTLKKSSKEDDASGSPDSDNPEAPDPTPNSAQEGGWEVAHDNMSH